MTMKPFLCVVGLLSVGCASPWKISGGPKECVSMCREWDMELAGMVGVGDQGSTGGGATACVCQVKGKGATAAETGSAGIAAGSAAVIVAIQEEERRQQEQAQQAANASKKP